MALELALWLYAAMIAWVPPREHYREPEERVTSRYLALAHTIADVALDPTEEPVQGDRAFTALLLASIAARESVFREDVMNCRVPGLGRAWGPYQYQGARARVCASWEQATRWALRMVRESFRACVRYDPGDRLAFYTDGRCVPRWWRSRSRVTRAWRWREKLESGAAEGS